MKDPVIAARIPATDLEALEALADAEDVAKSDLVRRAVALLLRGDEVPA